MRKTTALLLTLLLLLAMVGCSSEKDGTVQLEKIASLPAETLETHLTGLERDTILDTWGEPNGMLSGLYGDIWLIPDSDQQIIVYYDKDSLISGIKVIDQVQSE